MNNFLVINLYQLINKCPIIKYQLMSLFLKQIYVLQ